MTPADELLKEYGEEIGVGDTFKHDPGRGLLRRARRGGRRPVLRRRGPARAPAASAAAAAWSAAATAPRTRCVKNYLWFAERLGVEVAARAPGRPTIRPLGAADGSDGYAVDHRRPGAWLRKRRRTLHGARRGRRRGRARDQQAAGRAASTGGSLPRISDRLGRRWCAPTASRSRPSPRPTTAATSRARSRSPRASTPTPTPTSRSSPTARGGDAMSRLFTLHDRRGHAAHPAAEVARGDAPPPAPDRCGCSWPVKWSQRTVILLVMQSLDTAMRLRAKRRAARARACGSRPSRTPSGPTRPSSRPPSRPPAGSPSGSAASPQSGLTESIAQHPDHRPHPRRRGDRRRPRERRGRRPQPGLRLREPAGLRRRRGPANPGVNPSLTITALAERAMCFVPEREGAAPTSRASRRADELTRPPIAVRRRAPERSTSQTRSLPRPADARIAIA